MSLFYVNQSLFAKDLLATYLQLRLSV